MTDEHVFTITFTGQVIGDLSDLGLIVGTDHFRQGTFRITIDENYEGHDEDLSDEDMFDDDEPEVDWKNEGF